MAFPVALQQFQGCLNTKNHSCLFATCFTKYSSIDLYPYRKHPQKRGALKAQCLLPLTCTRCTYSAQPCPYLEPTGATVDVTTEYPVVEQ